MHAATPHMLVKEVFMIVTVPAFSRRLLTAQICYVPVYNLSNNTVHYDMVYQA